MDTQQGQQQMGTIDQMMQERSRRERAQEVMDGTPHLVTRYEQDYFAGQASNKPLVSIRFQIGPVKEFGHNGVQIEDIIDILVERLEAFQKGPYRCRTNALAITNLEQARMWLQERTRKRTAQGVEGINAPHTEASV